MKKLIYMVFIPLILLSCSKDDIDSSGIVGKWKAESASYPIAEFKANGKYNWKVLSRESNDSYRIAGKNLFLSSGGREYKFQFNIDGNRLEMSRNEEVFGDDFHKSYTLIRQ